MCFKTNSGSVFYTTVNHFFLILVVGVKIDISDFEYDKLRNILIAIGDVEIDDKKENIIITSQKVTYFKNKELL